MKTLIFLLLAGCISAPAARPHNLGDVPVPVTQPYSFTTDPGCYVCCGASFTAIPACGASNPTGLTAENYGANTVAIYPDGGSWLGAYLVGPVSSSGLQTGGPGQTMSIFEQTIPYGCLALGGTGQTDGGCTAIHWTK